MVATVDQQAQCTPILRCLACDSDVLRTYLDLGTQPLANAVHDDLLPELVEFPLAVNYCTTCTHSQLTHAVEPDLLFAHYDYVSGTTTTLSTYFDEFVTMVERERGHDNLRICDIAGNDGSLLSKFVARGHDVLNVDPAVNLTAISTAKGVPTHCAYWSSTLGDALGPQFDVIIAMNVLGHVGDPYDFLVGCQKALARDGRLYVQTSQAEWLLHSEFDYFYHEHLSAFTCQSFMALSHRAGLVARHVTKPDIHGTSYLFELTLPERGDPDASVQELLEWEEGNGYSDEQTYDAFADEAKATADWLTQVTDLYAEHGYAPIGYGAAAKFNTLLNYAQIGLDLIVDNNDMKVGKLTPGMNIPIAATTALTTIDEPLCCVIGAWNFRDEIIKRIKAIRDRDDDVFVQCWPQREVRQ